MKKIRIGIIGLGSISTMHFEAFRKLQDAEITAICSLSDTTLGKRSAEWGIKKSYNRYQDLLDDKEIDAVSIATPNKYHAPIAIAALNAGKHVFCEKPPALNSADAQAMADCAAKNGKVLMYGFMFRFTDKTKLIKEFLDSGMFGEIYHAKTGAIKRCGSPGGWFVNKAMAGGGPLIDMGVHIIDLAVYLMGDPVPVSVFGRTFSSMGSREHIKGRTFYQAAHPEGYAKDVEDGGAAMINFENGACLFVETSYSSHIKEDAMHLSLLGNKGGATVDPFLEIYSESLDYLVDIKPRIDGESFNYQKAIDDEIRHFSDCVLNGVKCISTPENGVKIMKIIDGIYESARTGASVRI